MTAYGDNDPEDSYDAGDPLGVRLALLARVVDAIREEPDEDRRFARRLDLFRVLESVANELHAGAQTVDRLVDDLEEMPI